jgi:hypothetical protein
LAVYLVWVIAAMEEAMNETRRPALIRGRRAILKASGALALCCALVAGLEACNTGPVGANRIPTEQQDSQLEVQLLSSAWNPGADGKWQTIDDSSGQLVDEGRMALSTAMQHASDALGVNVVVPRSPLLGIGPVVVTINSGPRSAAGEPAGLWHVEVWYGETRANPAGETPVSIDIIRLRPGTAQPGSIGGDPFMADPRLTAPTWIAQGDLVLVSAGAPGRWFIVRLLASRFDTPVAARDAAVKMMLSTL